MLHPTGRHLEESLQESKMVVEPSEQRPACDADGLETRGADYGAPMTAV